MSLRNSKAACGTQHTTDHGDFDNLGIWGKDYEITVYQRSKTVWIAVGEYMGEPLETKGSSERDAAAQWREAARYKGN